MQFGNFSNSEKFPRVYTYPMMIFWIASFLSWDVLCLLPVYTTTYLQTSSISRKSGQVGFVKYKSDLTSQFALHTLRRYLLCWTKQAECLLLILKCDIPFLSICIPAFCIKSILGVSFRLSPILRSARSWCTGFIWFQTVPVTMVHHTVLSQLCYVFLFVMTCTESSCQWWRWVIWAVI